MYRSVFKARVPWSNIGVVTGAVNILFKKKKEKNYKPLKMVGWFSLSFFFLSFLLAFLPSCFLVFFSPPPQSAAHRKTIPLVFTLSSISDVMQSISHRHFIFCE